MQQSTCSRLSQGELSTINISQTWYMRMICYGVYVTIYLDKKRKKEGYMLAKKLYVSDNLHFSSIGYSVLAKVIIGSTYKPHGSYNGI